MSSPTGLAPTFWEHLAETAMITSSATGSCGNRSPVEPASTYLALPTKLNYGPAAPAKRSRPPSPVRMLLKLAGKTSPSASPSTGPALNPLASARTERGRPREALGLGTGAAVPCSSLNFKEMILPRLVRAAMILAGKAMTLPDEVTAATLAQRYPELLPAEGTWRAVDQLRVHAGAPERSDAGIAKLLDYYSALLLLESCFPSGTADDLAVSFTWSEAFLGTDKSPKKVTASCFQCEKAAVLFNLAAVHAQLAAKQSVRSTDGIKTAALHFQSAAGILDYIRFELVPRFSAKVEKTADMSPDTLQALTELMLAQANECYWEKASTDGTSDTVISQLASQTAAHYEAVQLVGAKSDGPKILKALNPTASRGPRLPRNWLAHARTKALLYTAIAHRHSPHQRTEVGVGHRIARLTLAKSLVERNIKEPEQLSAILVRQCEYHRTRIAAALRSLEVENKMLGELVPDARSLAPLRRLPDPVATPIPFSPPDSIGTRAPLSSPGFGHVLLHPAHWPEWVQCVRTLDEVVNQLGPQVQRLLPKCDEIMALLRSSSSPVHGTTRGLDHGSELDLNPDKLVRTLQSLRAEESVLSLAQLMASLARASTTSRTLCARAQAMLDRVKMDHFAHDPKAFSTIAVLRPRLVALTTGVQQTADTVARLEGVSQAPEIRGAAWNEWTGNRIREAAARMARDKSAGHEQVDEPIALDELAPSLVAVRADLAKFAARLERTHVDLSSSESSAVTREVLLQQSASGQDVVERAERLIQRAATTQAQVADSVTQHQDALEAKTALSLIARTLSTMADIRSKAENALSTALDQQEQLEALVVECECLPGVQDVGVVSSLNAHADVILPLAPLSSGSNALNTPRSTGVMKLYCRLTAKASPAPVPPVLAAPAPTALPAAAMPSAPVAETTFYTAPTTPTPTRLYPSVSRPPSPPTDAVTRSSRRPSASSPEPISDTVPIIAAVLVPPIISVPVTELHPPSVRSRTPSASPAVHPPAVRSRTPSASPAPSAPAVRSRTPSASHAPVPPTVRSRTTSASPAPAPPTVRSQTPLTSPALQPPKARSRNPSASLALPPSSPARRPSVGTPTAASPCPDPALVDDSAVSSVPAASLSKQAPVLTDELLRGLDAVQTRADRTAQIDEWTAEQVELAKERKRKWKQATAAAASATSTADAPPSRATTYDASPDRSPPRLAATSMPSVHTSAPAPARTLRRRATSSKNRAWDRERELEHCFGQMSAQMAPDPAPLDEVLADSGLVASADSITQPEQQLRTETENVVKHFAAAAAIASGRVRSRSHRLTESGRPTHKVQGPAEDVSDAPVAFGGVPVPRPPSPVQKRVMDGDERRSARRRERVRAKRMREGAVS